MPNVSHDVDGWATMVPWRRRELRRAGFGARLSGQLAADMRYDIEALLVLTERGCAPQLAARILAPLHAPAARR